MKTSSKKCPLKMSLFGGDFGHFFEKMAFFESFVTLCLRSLGFIMLNSLSPFRSTGKLLFDFFSG